jgi:F-type H+-transporting ATPase subunit b
MEAILKQLEVLLLQAVPTVILVFLFYLFLKFNFFRPLQLVLAERQARTEGARHSAEQAQAEAKGKARAYEDALKKARTAIYAEQEAARRAILDERVALIRETRNQAMVEVRAAREQINGELDQARQQMEKECVTLGSELARAMLERRLDGGASPRDAQ